MLDDDGGRTFEFRGEAASRFEVDEIIVGELLALELLGGGQSARTVAGASWNVQSCCLVRIFSVAERLLQAQRNVQALGERLFFSQLDRRVFGTRGVRVPW